MTRSDEALYEALLKGDLRAFDQLYERHHRPLFGFIRKHIADFAEAEDVINEAFLAVLRDKLDGFRARSFRARLFQIARNLCLNRVRTARRQTRAFLKEEASTANQASAPEEVMEQDHIRSTLRNAVEKLSVERAELYCMRAQGMSYEEIAEVLTVPLGTVKSRMHQMLTQLRKEMQS